MSKGAIVVRATRVGILNGLGYTICFSHGVCYPLFLSVFPPEAIFRSRGIGACPVTAGCIVAMRECESNNNIDHNNGLPNIGAPFERCEAGHPQPDPRGPLDTKISALDCLILLSRLGQIISSHLTIYIYQGREICSDLVRSGSLLPGGPRIIRMIYVAHASWFGPVRCRPCATSHNGK